MLQFIKDDMLELLMVLSDTIRARSDHADYYIGIDGSREAKELRDKLIQILYLKHMNHMTNPKTGNRDIYAMLRKYGITAEEVEWIRERYRELRSGKAEPGAEGLISE